MVVDDTEDSGVGPHGARDVVVDESDSARAMPEVGGLDGEFVDRCFVVSFGVGREERNALRRSRWPVDMRDWLRARVFSGRRKRASSSVCRIAIAFCSSRSAAPFSHKKAGLT